MYNVNLLLSTSIIFIDCPLKQVSMLTSIVDYSNGWTSNPSLPSPSPCPRLSGFFMSHTEVNTDDAVKKHLERLY